MQAIQTLRHSSQAAGRCFFVPDDSPLRNCFDHFVPFLEARHYRLLPFRIPFIVIHVVIFIIEHLLHLLAPLRKINLELSLSGLKYSSKTYYFSRKQAEEMLGYKPLFTYEEALERSLKFYEKLEL